MTQPPRRTPAGGRRARVPWRLALATALGPLVAGCAPTPPTYLGTVARAVPDDPAREIDPSVLLAARQAAALADPPPEEVPCRAEPAAAPGRWTIHCPAVARRAAWRLFVELTDLLEAPLRVTFEASPCRELGVVEVRRTALRDGAERYEAPAPSSSAACADEPLRLEARALGAPGRTARLVRSGLRRLRPEELLPDPREPVRLRLGKDWRVGFVDGATVLPPAGEAGSGRSWALRTGVSLVGGTSCRLSVRRGEGRDRVEISSRVLEPSQGAPSAAWSELEVPLALAGGPLELASECRSGGDASMVLWADPRIVAQGRQPRPPNLVLISVDTLRADHLGSYGYPAPTSPALDRWFGSRGIVFEQVTAPAPWTYPSHVSMLTGIDSVRHGAYFGNQPIDLRRWQPLASRLRAHGYSTLAVTGGGWVDAELGFAVGFDRYRSWPDKATRELELDDNLRFLRELVDRGIAEPYFLFFHTYEVHSPNLAREPFFSRLSGFPDDLAVVGASGFEATPDNGFVPGSGALLRHPDGTQAPLPEDFAALPAALYDSAIALVDDRLGALLAHLEERGLLRDTIVVLTSDHGESLGERGRYWHGSLDEPNLGIPLLLRLPRDERSGLRIATPVRLLDLAPTLLEWTTGTAEGTDGQSLRPLIEGRKESADRAAWSYAASNNHGLALRRPRESKLVLLDAAWPQVAGRVDAFDLRGGGEEPSAGDPQALEEFRRRARNKLLAGFAGVLIELENASGRSLAAQLTQGFVGPSTLKLFDPGARVEWRGPGRVGLAIEPRATARIGLLRAPPEDFDVRLELEGADCAAAAPHVVRGADLTSGDGLEVRLACRPGAPEDALVVRFRASAGASSRPDPLTDELSKDLRALGYLQ